MKESILITSCGGPAAENVIKNFKLIKNRPRIYGTDVDPWMSLLSSADRKFLVDRADSPKYIHQLQDLINCLNISMIIPQSDAEVFTVSKARNTLSNVRMILPKHEVIELCQDKGTLYDFLKSNNIPVPVYKNISNEDIRNLFYESPNYGAGYGWVDWYPCWLRARRGAGGHKGTILQDYQDLKAMITLSKGRENIDWQMVKLLNGRNFSWTSLWNNGTLVTSVLKERIKWIYDRIGTTAIQRTIHHSIVNQYCIDIIESLKILDPHISGIMMIDLKEAIDEKRFYITEINAGRLGTVNYFYGYASQDVFGDNRVNFPWLMWRMIKGETLPQLPKIDAFPQGLYWIRHLDMGFKLMDNA